MSESQREAVEAPETAAEVAEIIGELLFVTTAKGATAEAKRDAYEKIAAYAIQAATGIAAGKEAKK
jgi:hypothetical protein